MNQTFYDGENHVSNDLKMKRQTRHFPIVVEIKKCFPDEDGLHRFLSIPLTEVEITKSLDSRRKAKKKAFH